VYFDCIDIQQVLKQQKNQIFRFRTLHLRGIFIRIFRTSAVLTALALCIAAPAQANVSEDFSQCDGLKQPRRSDDGMRGAATFEGLIFVAPAAPKQILAACDRALASGKLLPGQSLRRAHIMHARGAAKLQLGDNDGALADFDSAQAAGKDYAGDFFYQRSMGLSLSLLRAIALNEKGEKATALALAEQVANQRPFALEPVAFRLTWLLPRSTNTQKQALSH
jgi:hypothetical protein